MYLLLRDAWGIWPSNHYARIREDIIEKQL